MTQIFLSVLLKGVRPVIPTILILVAALGCAPQNSDEGNPSEANKSANILSPKDKVKDLFIGEGPDDVPSALGAPTWAKDPGFGSTFWYYGVDGSDPCIHSGHLCKQWGVEVIFEKDHLTNALRLDSDSAGGGLSGSPNWWK